MSTPRTLAAVTCAAWFAAASMLGAACTAGHEGTNGTLFGQGTTTSTTAVSTTTTIVETTTTMAPTTTSSTSTTSTSTTSTSTTSTTEAPTTTTELPGAKVPLRFDGLGDLRFGVAPEDAITYLSGILGNPTADSKWVAADQIGCEGSEARTVFWDDLRLTFGDESDISTGRRHFFTWSFGPPAGLGPKPAGLATQLGVTVGTSVADILKAYPSAHLSGGDDASAELSEDLVVYLTSIAPTGVVTKLVGGTPCTK